MNTVKLHELLNKAGLKMGLADIFEGARMDGFLCQDLEPKLFKWFEGRLDASIIKREPENKPERGNHISDFYVGEVVRWKYNGEHGVVSKINETTSTLEVIFDSGYDSLFWVDQLEKVVSA